jgi:hypothetical protein
MTRPACSAALLHHGRHRCRERWYFVTDPDGPFDFCSAACLLSYAVYGLRVDIGAQQDQAGVAALTPRRQTAC